MHVLVCAATATEHGACATGIAASGTTTVIETLLVGVGGAHAVRSLRRRLLDGPTPTKIVSTGFAGALDGHTAVGTWITAGDVLEWAADEARFVDAVTPIRSAPAMTVCNVVSVDHLVGRHSPVRRLAGDAPLVADMESAALAREARRNGIEFGVARFVSDSLAHPLPEFLAPFTAAMASTDRRARLAHLARGMGSAVVDPRGVLRVLSESRTWVLGLQDGWTALARTI